MAIREEAQMRSSGGARLAVQAPIHRPDNPLAADGAAKLLERSLAQAAQQISDGHTRLAGGRGWRRGARLALRQARSALLLACDPPVRYRVGGSELSLPLSHDLPY